AELSSTRRKATRFLPSSLLACSERSHGRRQLPPPRGIRSALNRWQTDPEAAALRRRASDPITIDPARKENSTCRMRPAELAIEPRNRLELACRTASSILPRLSLPSESAFLLLYGWSQRRRRLHRCQIRRGY